MSEQAVLAGHQAEPLLRELAGWGNTTTIILHGGCVFEFKGDFPPGSIAEGYYNLEGQMPGFHGHINLERIDHIAFQDRLHRGRQSYALVFNDAVGETLFKVFVGRDEQGELLVDQVRAFQRMRDNLTV